MSDIILTKPENVTVRGGQRLAVVNSDVFNISERVKEIDPSLRLILHENHPQPWVVTEVGTDGVEYFVSRYEELGSHILDDLRYMRAVPFMQRYEKVAKEADEANRRNGHFDEETMERFADDFNRAARESNLFDPVWGKSYRNVRGKKRPKRN